MLYAPGIGAHDGKQVLCKENSCDGKWNGTQNSQKNRLNGCCSCIFHLLFTDPSGDDCCNCHGKSHSKRVQQEQIGFCKSDCCYSRRSQFTDKKYIYYS